MPLVAHRHEDLEEGGAGLGVLTRHDLEDRLALFRRGALVDDGLDFAMTHVDRARPGGGRGQAQAVELHLAVMTFLDLYPDRRATGTVGGQGVELAGTTIRTIARCDLGTADHPVGMSHALLLCGL